MPASLDHTLETLKAVAEESRLRLLAICAQGEFSVTELTHILGQSQPRVSRHLKVLLSAGLVMRFRERHSVLYRAVARGEEARFITETLAMLPADDPMLQRDRLRLGEIREERAKAAARYLRFHAEDWHRLLDSSIGSAQFNRAVLEAVSSARGGDLGDLLDIGTGTGRILKLLGRHAQNATGIDNDPRMLKVARAALHESRIDNALVRQADMYDLPFPAQAFDTVTIDQILFQAERPAQVIAEASRVLKPDGCLLIVDFARGSEGKEQAPDNARHVGVRESDVEEWLRRAGLSSRRTNRLRSEALTVMLTVAQRGSAQVVAA